MQKTTAYINIGSNMGDRRANIGRAVALISESVGEPSGVSRVVESEPWGYESTNRFLNIGIVVDTDLAPEELLDRLQAVERAISPESHRDANGAYIDRLIDVDLIVYGGAVVDTPRLKVPHPHMAQRRFVLEPLAELLPDWHHPCTGLTVADMMASLQD
ncbi:MAG: 2-amino-4-hydroxy-6-hydroxymethyldihydropteridine diphosphokinase [Muribaculaceae bacterium]|nr:2-amino-4-hydroxy-6-hydroxymethyldihydropteridine diphosphokinase [Muribaculaceae bacterium]